MVRKYDQIDERLLQWLREHPEQATTAKAIEALEITDTTTQRHIYRDPHKPTNIDLSDPKNPPTTSVIY